MLNICILYNVNVSINEHDYDIGSLGGSETWVVQLSKYLARMKDIKVTVLCKTNYDYIDADGVHWVSILNDYKGFLESNKFDCIILSRNLGETVRDIAEAKTTRCILIQAHDHTLYRNMKMLYYDDPDLHHRLVKGIVGLTKYHVDSLNYHFGVPEDKLHIIGNGVDIDLIKFAEEPQERDNNILFSSCWSRGLDLLVDEIFPEVKKEIPDMHIDYAYYNDIPEWCTTHENINYIGRLTKEELYKEMKKHKVWFYPSTFSETFCISAIEAALCGNELAMTYQSGPGSILNIFKHTGTVHKMEHNFMLPSETNINIELCKKELIELIIKSIKNYDNEYLRNMRQCRINYIEENYSWERIAQQWKELIERMID